VVTSDTSFVVQIIADTLVLPLVAIATIALLVCVPNVKKFSVYSRMLLAGLTSYLIAKLMATAWQPNSERPFETMGLEPGVSYLDNPGFPSDHALFVWVIFFAVWFGVRNPWLVGLCAVVAALVSIGRVLALVHAPIDVLGGFIAAALGALWYIDARRQRILAKK